MKLSTCVFALLCVATPLSAQDPRLTSRFQGAALARLTTVIDQATARGIPSELLIQKVLEGVTKEARPEQIVDVLRAYTGRLELARTQLGANATAEELAAGASALYVGVMPAALGQLRALRPNESLAMPLTTLTYFVQRGVAVDASYKWIESMVRNNVAHDELLQMHQLIESDVRAGADARAASAARAEAVLLRYRRDG